VGAVATGRHCRAAVRPAAGDTATAGDNVGQQDLADGRWQVGQILGASEGLGFLITRQRTLLNSPGVYAGIILVLLMTGVHELLLRKLEQRVAMFRES
jgi:NitT/TauT family transport system permease protein/taurine transport system permease protein